MPKCPRHLKGGGHAWVRDGKTGKVKCTHCGNPQRNNDLDVAKFNDPDFKRNRDIRRAVAERWRQR